MRLHGPIPYCPYCAVLCALGTGAAALARSPGRSRAVYPCATDCAAQGSVFAGPALSLAGVPGTWGLAATWFRAILIWSSLSSWSVLGAGLPFGGPSFRVFYVHNGLQHKKTLQKARKDQNPRPFSAIIVSLTWLVTCIALF